MQALKAAMLVQPHPMFQECSGKWVPLAMVKFPCPQALAPPFQQGLAE